MMSFFIWGHFRMYPVMDVNFSDESTMIDCLQEKIDIYHYNLSRKISSIWVGDCNNRFDEYYRKVGKCGPALFMKKWFLQLIYHEYKDLQLM